jgi:peptide deformylase
MIIRKYGDPILRKRAASISRITSVHKLLAKEMLQVIEKENAAGLAAPQVGASVQLIVVKLDKKFIVMINPYVFNASKELAVLEEGCLSIPDRKINVSRPSSIDINYIDLNGRSKSLHIGGINTHIVLHEIDHLQGRLILDYEIINSNSVS